jgi:hypothetical protein
MEWLPVFTAFQTHGLYGEGFLWKIVVSVADETSRDQEGIAFAKLTVIFSNSLAFHKSLLELVFYSNKSS